jgi:hypothetical protein
MLCCTFNINYTHKVVKDFRLTNNPIKVKESSVTRTGLLFLGVIIIPAYRRMMMNSEDRKVAILSCILIISNHLVDHGYAKSK